jgi:dTDP-4-amino-4,6-dideoxygalactose transaminase
MIPRAKANFSMPELLWAARLTERNAQYKERLRIQLRDYLGIPNILLTPSGRCGLYAILRGLPQPTVIVPAYTCNAVVEASLMAGKQVQYVDISPGEFNVRPSALEGLVSKDTVVIATHQFGIPCDIHAMVDLCRRRGAMIVEDVAAALGTRVDGQLAGTFGDAAFFSFDCTKLIHVPLKGGCVAVREPGLFQRIQDAYRREIVPMPPTVKMRLLAMATCMLAIENHTVYRLFYWLHFQRTGSFTAETAELNMERTIFYRYDLANWQAYIASQQMARINELIEKRRAVYREYRDRLAAVRHFALPPPDGNDQWACIRFPIRVHSDKIAFYRRCVARGVDFAFSFSFLAAPDRFRAAHELAEAVLDLPYYEKLRSAELTQVVEVLQSIDMGEVR